MLLKTYLFKNNFTIFFWLVFFITVIDIKFINALEPHEILVLANRNSSSSVGLAHYYIKQRNIPEHNLVSLWVTDNEVCTREIYINKIVPPVRRFLDSSNGKNIRCIVTVYGVPLKISPPEPDQKELQEMNLLTQKRDALAKEIQSSEAKANEDIVKKYDKVLKQINDFKVRHDKWASLDSELSLVKKKQYELSFWLPNPLFLPYRHINDMPLSIEDLIMVSRLDGPDALTVKRIINDSIDVEKKGLKGNGCFDARWKEPDDNKKLSGYALTDKLIHIAARAAEKSGLLNKVFKDDSERLFQAGECPDTALYCGWYSLAKYVDAFTWAEGSIGYHIASSECNTLKAGKSEVWCKRMLENGIAAAIGPVGEPYVQSFPNPEIFFKLILDGRLNLVECYYLSLPFVSWKMVLIGDPLYKPFKSSKI